MTTIKTTMMAGLALATLAAGLSGADARGFGGGGHGGFGGRGIAVGERYPGGHGGHGGWGHRGGFYGFGYPVGGYVASSYGGVGDCELIFSPRRGRYVRACD